MARAAYHLERGDIVNLNFNPQRGREIADRHFAIVLSPLPYNRKSGLAIVAPATTKYHSDFDSWMLPVPEGIINQLSGARFTGWIYTDQLKSLDYRERDFVKVGKAPPDFVERIIDYALTLLDPAQG